MFWSVKAQRCVEPYENIYINSDTVLCRGTYNLNDEDNNGVIIINASNIVLDCNETILNGNRTALSSGISNGFINYTSGSKITNGYDDVIVKNCKIQNYFIGIYWVNASNGLVDNNTIDNSIRAGITSDYSTNNVFSKNKILNTYGSVSFGNTNMWNFAGLEIRHSDYISINDNIAKNNHEHGIFVGMSENIHLTNNTANDNENGIVVFLVNQTDLINNRANNNIYSGLVIQECNFVNLDNNEAMNSLVGIAVQANHSRLARNCVSSNYAGIGLTSGTSNTSLVGNIMKNITKSLNITHNPHVPKFCYNLTLIENSANLTNVLTGYYPSGYGIGLEECKNIIVSNNKADHNELTGIGLIQSEDNLISNNFISNNENYGGILLSLSNNNNVNGNNVTENIYGIYSDYSNYNDLKSNELSRNTYDGVIIDGSNSVDVILNNVSFNHVGIRVTDSSNFNIINNTLSDNEQADIIVDPSNNFQIIENEISSSSYGIEVIETTNSNISKNIIELNNVGARITDSSNFDIINNTFKNNSQANIIIDPSNNFRLIDNLIFLSDFGLKIIDSVGGILLRNLFKHNNYSIKLESSVVITNDSVIEDSVFYDILLENSNNTFTNTTYDSQKVNITGTSILPVIWYLDIRILDQNENPIEDASVIGYDNNNTEVFSLTSDSNGYIPTQELIEYIQNSNERILYSPYIVQVEKEDYIIDIEVFNLTENMILNITLLSSTTSSDVDIDPDNINFKSKGNFIKAFIEVPGYNVSNIDINTVKINETISAINDTKYGFVKDPKIEDRDEDGLLEYMAVFDRGLVKSIVQEGDNILTVTGDIENTNFRGSDMVYVKHKK
jgi:parallel beta-helix repeat protein